MQSQSLGLPLKFQLAEEMCTTPQVFLKMAPWPSGHGANHKSSLFSLIEAGERSTRLWLRQRCLGVKHREGITFPQDAGRSQGGWDLKKILGKEDTWCTSEDAVSLQRLGEEIV